MPDGFELQHAALGLDPAVFDANGSELSMALTGVAGYTNLECYLNRLADALAGDSAGRVFRNGFEGSQGRASLLMALCCGRRIAPVKPFVPMLRQA